MKNTATYTSTLSTDMMLTLSDYSKKLKMPKNKIIEMALVNYLAELKKQEYINSFQRANQDKEMLEIAEEGMEDYLKMLNNVEK
jgi:hypothetical protein